jgi:hypothetical protein
MPENLYIIEDCSPYFIRFKFDQLEKIVSLIKSQESNLSVKQTDTAYIHKDFPKSVTEKIVSYLPRDFEFNFDNSAIFETPPGGGCGIHKDGKDNRISFNIPIQVLDNKCITYWYNDSEQFNNLSLSGGSYSRNIYSDHNTLDKFVFSKSLIAQENEMILLNTDIFHAWKNYSLENVRKMFVLRLINRNVLYFDIAKKILGF